MSVEAVKLHEPTADTAANLRSLEAHIMGVTDPVPSDLSSVVDEMKARKDQLEAALLDVQAVAALLSCSTRHVYRLADAGRMPRPVKLGALVRWNRNSVLTWIAEGCPFCRKGGR